MYKLLDRGLCLPEGGGKILVQFQRFLNLGYDNMMFYKNYDDDEIVPMNAIIK